ncbi:Skp family chaperone for outer membrane proteins [Sphingomonas zeicaulis]|uniref:OmpH family outer membrane protein n=1 Tax=Sphingomonas zeicaulis TaxID=1632740 RepID=UPI003D22C415
MSIIGCRGLATAALVTLAAAPAVQAQAQPAAPSLGGPVIPGLCLLSIDTMIATSKVGVATEARLKELATQAQTEVDTQRRPVEAEIKAFQAAAAGLKPEDRAARQRALATKLQPIEAVAQQRTRELQATRAKALQRISTDAQPVIAQVYKQKNCGLLINRGTVLGGNTTNDLTAAVVQGLDAKVSTVSFNREVLPAAAAAPQR